MEIRINTDESGADEFTALIALFASLGGRLPNGSASAPTPFKGDVPSQIAETRGPVATPVREDEESGKFPSADDAERNVDSKGTPWDGRIHSESKATVADGTWRKRRGVSDELFNEVMAELTAGAPPPPPADEQDEEVSLAPADESDVPAPPAPTEDKPSEPAPAASAPAAGDGQFADFPAFVGAVSKHGKTYAELNEMAGMLGVPMFKDMKDHADKWDMFFSMIG
jgi:hypothetical protein